MEDLNSQNYLLFAAKHYFPVHYSLAEFNSDLKRIVYVKRLLKKYKNDNILMERLILNHLILLFNVFEPTIAVNKMLFFKIDEDCYSSLKTFLIYLNRMSNVIELNNKKILSSDIIVDMEIANILRNL